MNTPQKQNDIPLPLAMALLFAVVIAYFYFTQLRFHPFELELVLRLVKINAGFITLSIFALAVNFAFLGYLLKRNLGLVRQGSRLAFLEGRKSGFRLKHNAILSLLIGGTGYYCTLGLVRSSISPALKAYATRVGLHWMDIAVSANLALLFAIVSYVCFAVIGSIRFSVFGRHKLLLPETQIGDLVLGTTTGELSHDGKVDEESWVTIPSRGVNGGVFISGSVGSGKTQGTILRYLSQIISNREMTPTMLLIDPKRTFLKEAEAILIKAGLGDRIVKISLNGDVTFNPIYAKEPLKDSGFTGLAEMARAAAVNFMGKSSDSPFWDISSANLVKNAIVYCAAKYGYFTLTHMYRTIVRAAKEDLASELKECLLQKPWRYDEKFNIESSIEYFENEYSQLEDRVRTGIVATSTAFINQFQEYAASRIFCPSEARLTIPSMEELVRERKIILFDVNQPGLGRSMGTFVKLHYQQAVLNLLPELKEAGLPCTSALIIDEYQDVVTCGGGGTLGDESFIAKVRESKPAVIVATQSLSSLMNSVGSQRPALELVQNFRTRIACHSSDLETIKLFQELAGKEDIENQTRSLSETAQSAKLNLFAGGFESENASLNESVSKSVRREDLVTGKEFSRLRTFEAFAQVFDGIETKFLKLYLKPHFLKAINTKHETVLEILRVSVKGGVLEKIKIAAKKIRAVAASLLLAGPVHGAMIPNVCTVASSPAFASCLELNIGACTCGWPPRPCSSISYYVPQSFAEVWPEPRTSYFNTIPSAGLQLAKLIPRPYGAEGDDDTQSFQARTIAVPLAGLVFQAMPAGGTRTEKMCFDGMSEHFGSHWDTGKGDLLQPTFLAWGAAPKACLLTGAATSIVGDGGGSDFAADSAVCSFPFPKLEVLPPSAHPVCNGWGVFFPRYGTYAGPASMTGALMIASRIKSLSSEVLKTMPASPDEKWQMIYPQSSSCFREGQNISVLETVKNSRETMRLANGKLKGYLFAIWKRTWTCTDLPAAIQAKAAALAIPAACGGMK